MTEENKNDISKLFDMNKILEEIGAKPATLLIRNIAIMKGSSLQGLIVNPDIMKTYISEDTAKKELAPNQRLYKVDVYRIE